MTIAKKSTVFFLGGKDLEMCTIADMLKEHGWRYADRDLGWGANVERYDREIASAGAIGDTLVFVELDGADNYAADDRFATIVVDHHKYEEIDYSDRPASIVQVAELIGVELTRYQRLVAANDAGYIPAMIAAGATEEEIAEVRRADRKAQGVTEEQEMQAAEAIKTRKKVGACAVVRMPHSRCAPVTDALYGKEFNILIISENGEVNFYGDGAICVRLMEAFGGWSGGEGLGKKGESAFWGKDDGPSEENLLAVING